VAKLTTEKPRSLKACWPMRSGPKANGSNPTLGIEAWAPQRNSKQTLFRLLFPFLLLKRFSSFATFHMADLSFA
jgi:hypothetical protein